MGLNFCKAHSSYPALLIIPDFSHDAKLSGSKTFLLEFSFSSIQEKFRIEDIAEAEFDFRHEIFKHKSTQENKFQSNFCPPNADIYLRFSREIYVPIG